MKGTLAYCRSRIFVWSFESWDLRTDLCDYYSTCRNLWVEFKDTANTCRLQTKRLLRKSPLERACEKKLLYCTRRPSTDGRSKQEICTRTKSSEAEGCFFSTTYYARGQELYKTITEQHRNDFYFDHQDFLR